jgi:hypothetical protein
MWWRKRPNNRPSGENTAADDNAEYRWDNKKWTVPPYEHWYAANTDYQADERNYWRKQVKATWAQVWAARANISLGVITLTIAVAAAIVAGSAYLTSLDALTEAQRQTAQAKRQAAASEAQAAVAHDTEERQLRAYVLGSARDPLVNFAEHGKAHVQGHLENVGQTPVYDATILSGINVLDYPLKGAIAYGPCSQIMAQADASHYFFGKEANPTKDRDAEFTSDEIKAVNAETSAVYYHGRICYKDIFAKVRHSEFCVFWTWNKDHLDSAKYCTQGNGADEPDGPWPPVNSQPPTTTK